MQTSPRRYPAVVSLLLAFATVISSVAVSYIVTGTLFGTVSMTELRKFGGTTFGDLGHFEVWRIAGAQLIHAKQGHMLFNAACILLLGSLVENRVGGLWTFLVWLVAGGVATILSPVLVEAPWNVGTGASQATAAFAGCAAVLAVLRAIDRRRTFPLVGLVLGITFALDLVYAGYPKPGHLIGLLLGGMFGLAYAGRPRADDEAVGHALVAKGTPGSYPAQGAEARSEGRDGCRKDGV